MDISIGAGYDTFTSQYSPDGRIFQVEYAAMATENGGTVIGLRGSDGIVFAAENLVSSKLYETGGNSRIFTIDQHIGLAVAGLKADARHIVNQAKEDVENYRVQYNQRAPLKFLRNSISMYMHAYTLYSAFRPFGTSLIIGAYEFDVPKMYCIDPSGLWLGYFGCAIGKARQAAASEMEKIDLENASIVKLVKEAAKIIYTVHEDDKDFELELSWVGKLTGGKHMLVPPQVYSHAVQFAKIMVDDVDEDDDEDDTDI